VYEFDEAEDANFISMAYIEGQSLRKKIESKRRGGQEMLPRFPDTGKFYEGRSYRIKK